MVVANEEIIPVFANEVFVVFSSYKQISRVSKNSPNLIYFREWL
jgi:hypothetical protein